MKNLYMVYDTVAQCVVGGIIQEPNDAPAIRAFHDALGDKNSFLASHPADYNMMRIGYINSQGIITTEENTLPSTVAHGAAWAATSLPTA
ncbi:MAG: nonstructural protein [Microvirus sp.]|nr:MAG: nonstructural protein [Microvirus sp.]